MAVTSTFGLDLAKSVFQVHGADAQGNKTMSRQIKRKELLTFFKKQPACLVGLEACGSAHHWARQLTVIGHSVKMLPAKYVKAYVKRGKTDAADAEAICEAVTRPRITGVPVKSVRQQCMGLPDKARNLLKGQQVALINARRGHMAEFGIAAPEGRPGTVELCELIVSKTSNDVPCEARPVLTIMVQTLNGIEGAITQLDAEILAAGKTNETVKRLLMIPGVGPLAASAFAALVTSPRAFKSGRAFAASLGLTPTISGTGGEVKLGSITKQGNGYLRQLLYLGGVARLAWARRCPAKADPDLVRLLAEKPFKVVAVALANRTARVVWALLVRGGSFNKAHKNNQPKPAV